MSQSAGDPPASWGVDNRNAWLTKVTLSMTGPRPDLAVFYRARALLAFAALLFGLAVSWGSVHFVAGAHHLGSLFFVCAGIVVLIGMYLRRTHRVELAAHLVVSAGLVGTALATALTGGLRATNVCPYFMLIVASVFLLGRAGLPWAGASILTALGFEVAAWAGVTLPDTIPSSSASLDRFVTWISSAFVVFFFAWAYESSRVRNIARLNQANDALAESEATYRLVVAHANDAIVLVCEGAVVFFNDRAREMIGIQDEELVGRDFLDFVYPADRTRAEQRHADRMRGRFHDRAFEARLVNQRGSVVFVEVSAALLRWEGRPAALYFLKDVTARRQTEHALRRAEKSLRRAQRLEAIGRVAAGVAHDFNNYLSTIRGAAESIDTRSQAGERPDTEIDEIRKATELAATLTRQLLAFGSKQTLKPAVVQLNHVIEELRPMIERLVGDAVELRTDLGDDLGPVRLDAGQIEQVIMNLLLNATEAMPEGGRLTVATENADLSDATGPVDPDTTRGAFVCLTVQDSGTGMDADTLEHAFEPFFTTKRAGSGLGLAVVYGIVKQHEGWISIDSEPGKGTIFRVYLPRCDVEERSLDEPAVGGAGRCVLLVEDLDSVRRYTAGVLRKHGYHVCEASDVRQAERCYESEPGPFDLLLVDVVLEEDSGLALVEALRARDPSLKVLLSSGYVENDLARMGLSAKGYPFLQKPYDPQTLLRAVRDAIGG